ncbi:MAG: alpha/beta hydrolase [bacterium]|nr:alpha/beta hydrolase [bacterium]
MKRISITTILLLTINFYINAQARLVNVKSKTFKTSSGVELQGQVGFLEVPENRNNPDSRKIKMKFVHVKSLAENPSTPVIYLEGGGGTSTWEVNSPRDLNDRMEFFEVSDFIYLDRRGANDRTLMHIWRDDYPSEFFISEEKATEHYQKMAEQALAQFEKKKIDITGYNIEEHAQDVNDLASALGFDKYTIFGFSYGSHIGMTVMNLFPEKVERAILVGADAPNQSLNFPSHLGQHIEKISTMVANDSILSETIPDFKSLVYETMEKLEKNPITVTVKNPLNKKNVDLKIGPFGFAVVLRLDIDDANDIPVIPRLVYSVNQGDNSMLTWFVQKRMVFALGFPGQGINQQLATGTSDSRWSTILKEADESPFGNVVNFPFSAVKETWISSNISNDYTTPLKTDIPTLFVTGELDCRTPVQQVEETMKGFSNAVHIKVESAGHEQAQWSWKVANEIIPSFMKGEIIEPQGSRYGKIEFIPVTGDVMGHPSIE